MLLGEIPRVLLRRWYVVVFGLLVTAGLTLGTLSAVLPTYAVSTEILLLPPATVVPAGSNPYLALSGLESIGSVASKRMNDDQTQRVVKAQFGTIDYSVALDPTAAAPMLLITAESKSPALSTAAERFLIARLPGVLKDLQDAAAVPEKSRVSTTSVIPPDTPKVNRKSQVRALIAVAALGLVLTVIGAAAADALVARRRTRTARHLADNDGGDPDLSSPPDGLGAGPQRDGQGSPSDLPTALDKPRKRRLRDKSPEDRTKDLTRVSG